MDGQDAVKWFRKRRAARLGFKTTERFDSGYESRVMGIAKTDEANSKAVRRYKKRRQARLDARKIRLDDDNENMTGPKRGGGHGNTKIPFGLCQREGIEIQPGWTPKDAWEALEDKGYNPGEVYKNLKATGKAGNSGGKAESTTTVAKPTKMSVKEANKVSREYSDVRKKFLDSQTDLRIARSKVQGDEYSIQLYEEERIPKAQKEYDDAKKAYDKIKTGKTSKQLEEEKKAVEKEADDLIAFSGSLTRKPPDVGSPERERWEKAMLGSAEEVIGPPPEEGTEERERWNRWAFDTMAYDIGVIAQKKMFGQVNEVLDRIRKLDEEKNKMASLESKKAALDKFNAKLNELKELKSINEKKAAEAEAATNESERYLKENADKYRDAVNSKFPTYEDCKTFEDVEEKLRANGCVGHDKRVNFEGLTIDSAIFAARSINEFYDKVPEMKMRLGEIWAENLDYGTYAGSVGCTEILLNMREFGNLAKMEESWEKDVNSGFHPEGTSTSAILYHEMAHQMDSFLTQVLRKDDLQQHWTNRKNISTVILEEVSNNLGMSPDKVKKEVSGYAEKQAVLDAADDRTIKQAGFYNGRDVEFFAEAIAEYIGSPKPRRVAVEVWNCLQKYIQQANGKELEK